MDDEDFKPDPDAPKAKKCTNCASPRPIEEQPALMAAAATTAEPSRERPVVDAALSISTDELRLWADSDEENGPPVYRRRSGTLFRHAPTTPEVTRRRAPRHTV